MEAFYCRDGKVVSNLQELQECLKGMSDDEFSHHVTQQKNDFAEWIHHTLADDNFAMKVRAAQNKTDLVLTLNEKLMRQEISEKLKDMRQPAPAQPDAQPASAEPITPPVKPLQSEPDVPEADVDKKLAALDAGTLDTEEPSGLHDLAESTEKPADVKSVEKPAEIKPVKTADKPAAQPEATLEKETPEQKKHDPRFFNLKEFIIGLMLAFAIGFILCKILFSTIWG